MYMSTSYGDRTWMVDAIQMHNKREEKLSVQISRQQNHSKGRVVGKNPKQFLPVKEIFIFLLSKLAMRLFTNRQDRTSYKHSTETTQTQCSSD